VTATRSRSLERSIEDLVYRAAEPRDRVAHNSILVGALIDLVDERRGQEEIGDRKREAGIDWCSCADPDMAGGDGGRYLVLGEEFGEVGRAILEAGYGSRDAAISTEWERRLRAELVQVAAVSLAWIEAIDARELPF
jgi:hypothetical protein